MTVRGQKISSQLDQNRGKLIEGSPNILKAAQLLNGSYTERVVPEVFQFFGRYLARRHVQPEHWSDLAREILGHPPGLLHQIDIVSPLPNDGLSRSNNIENAAIDGFVISFWINGPQLVLFDHRIVDGHTFKKHETHLLRVAPGNVAADGG